MTLADRCQDKWPGILMRLGVLSGKALDGKDAPCPLCGGKDRFRLSDKGRGFWYCHSEREGGDGFKLVMKVTGLDFKGAAKLIEGVVGKADWKPTSCASTTGRTIH
jgi:putative DNA primase/helicase